MTNWLLRTFIRNSEDLEDSKVRAAVGQLAGIVGILCNILLFSGKLAVGHVRYGTSGAKSWEAAQPHLSAINDVIIALAHNGTLVNSNSLRREMINLGIPFRSNTDSEVAAKLVVYFTEQTSHLREGIARTMQMV